MGYGIMGRGDYGIYRGDPGLFGFIKKIGGGLLRGIVGASPLGQAARFIQRAIPVRGPRRPVGFPGMGLAGMPLGERFKRGAQMMMPGGRTGLEGLGPRRRRMNVANPKALRKAIRRQAGFVKLAKKALKGTGYRIVTKGSGRSRRDLPPGHAHVR